MSAAARQGQINVGSKVFVGPNDSDDVYDVMEVNAIDMVKSTCDVAAAGRSGMEANKTVPLAQCFAMNPKHNSDLCGLHNIHEAGILANLEGRIGQEEPLAYTYLNTVLVAVNPLKVLKNQPHFAEYVDQHFDPEKPHPYAIAELAYQNLRMPRESEPPSQSIVISGESGAGKTETAKIVLSYLSNRSSSDGMVDMSNARVAECILDSTPIFEEFGNAKTLRNSNSSRFGKFISLQFSPDLGYTLIGAFVTTYLLEKTRVCYQMKGERNYHIFYDLLSGAASQGELCLEPNPAKYFYLNQAGNKEGGEAGMFDHVCHAMEVIGIHESDRLDLWKVLSGVLHLGNTAILERDTVEGLKSAIEDMRHCALAANMFGVDTDALAELLTVKRTHVRGQEIVIKLQRDEATFRRDAVAKALYAALFDWIVDMANDHLGYKQGEPLPFIGVLDIFGFESFEVNGLEQILINFANEYLQNVFNRQVFEAELKLFQEENILCSLDAAPDNAPCVALLANKGGVLDHLNAQCASIQPSEDKYVRDLSKEHKGHAFFPAVHRKDARECFAVLHFAGPVQYTVGGWLLKNSDPLPEALPAVFANSSLKLVRHILRRDIGRFQAEAAEAAEPGGAGLGRGAKAGKKNQTTVSQSFVKSMKNLTVELGSTKCNFIRCIKPNPLMRAGVYNRKYVVDQLRCLGILATCEVLKAGMPTRVTYKELKAALSHLPANTLDLFTNQPEEVLIAASMWAFEVPADAYQLGRTRVFFKAGEISRVEAILKTDLSGGEGDRINARIRTALERRRQALEAVLGVEALMQRLSPGVAAATELLGNVEDVWRQVSRDHASSSGELLFKAAASCAKFARDRGDVASALNKVRGDPRLSTAAGGEDALSRAEDALGVAAEVEAGMGAQDVEGRRRQYAVLRDEMRDLVDLTKALVGDVTNGMDRVALLHREAEDGAKRCLLDYTLERTSAAESECEGLAVTVAEVDGGAAGAKADELSATNDAMRSACAAAATAVSELASQGASSLHAATEALKGVRSEMRRAESAANAAKAAAGIESPPGHGLGGGGGNGMGGGGMGGGGVMMMGGGGGMGGGHGMVLSPEMAGVVEALASKVKLIESHHGEQLRALVAKTKELHRVVKYQQELLAQVQGGNDGNGNGAAAALAGLSSPPKLSASPRRTHPPLAPSSSGDGAAVSDTPELNDALFSTEGPSAEEVETRLLLEEMRGDGDGRGQGRGGGGGAEGGGGAGDDDDAAAGAQQAAQAAQAAQADEDALVLENGTVADKVGRLVEREAALRGRLEATETKLEASEAASAAAEVKVAALSDVVEALKNDLIKFKEQAMEGLAAAGAGGGRGSRGSRSGRDRSPAPGGGDGGRESGGSSSSHRGSRSGRDRSPGGRRRSSQLRDVSVSGGGGHGDGASPSGGGDEPASSRLKLWANIRDRMFGGTQTRARMLSLKIIEATFHDTSKNQKLPLDAYIEIRNITTGQVETTSTVRHSYKPKYNEDFVFKTKQNANDMIMMKIMENEAGGSGPTIFGSVALPLDSKHTQGAQIPMPIFDEGLNMKGVVRVAAKWSVHFPRKLQVSLLGVKDCEPAAHAQSAAHAAENNAVQVKLSTSSGSSQRGAPCGLSKGSADLQMQTLDQVSVDSESDKVVVELFVISGASGDVVSFGKAEIGHPAEGPAKDMRVPIAYAHGAPPALVLLRSSWGDGV